MNTNELSSQQLSHMRSGYDLALAANKVFDIRKNRSIEQALELAEVATRESAPNYILPMRKVLYISQENYDADTQTYNGLLDAAALLMPDRKVIDNSGIKILFSNLAQFESYQFPPGQ